MAFSPLSSRRCSSVSPPLALATIVAGAACTLFSGCATVRTSNSLGVQQTSETAFDRPYFVVSAEGFKNYDPVPFNQMLHARYPSLFAQTPDAVPIMIRVEQGATKSSDAIPVFLLGLMPQMLTCGLVGTVWEHDWSKLDVGIVVSDEEEPTTSVEVSASRYLHGLLNAAVARLVQWPSRGWHRPRGDLVAEEFEGLVNAIADSLAVTLANMTPESKAALRKNPVALQLFQKKFPWGFGVRKRGVAEKTIHVYPEQTEGDMDGFGVVGFEFDVGTRIGRICADVSGCDYAAAQRRLISSEIPRLCLERSGREISLLSIRGETQGQDGILEISFAVVE